MAFFWRPGNEEVIAVSKLVIFPFSKVDGHVGVTKIQPVAFDGFHVVPAEKATEAEDKNCRCLKIRQGVGEGGAPSHAKHEMTFLNCRRLSDGLRWIGLLWRRRRAWHSCLTVGWLVGSATLAFSCIHRRVATDCVVAAHEAVSCARWRRNRATWGALAGSVGSLSSVA